MVSVEFELLSFEMYGQETPGMIVQVQYLKVCRLVHRQDNMGSIKVSSPGCKR